jgi:hypothetical protein
MASASKTPTPPHHQPLGWGCDPERARGAAGLRRYGKPFCTSSRIVTALVSYPFAARPPNNVVFASSARDERATRSNSRANRFI